MAFLTMGASVRTENFIVNAPSPQVAKQVGEAAEKYRHDLAIEWLGEPLRPWAKRCPINVRVGGGAGGVTSFMFEQGHVFGWQMNIQGSLERILDSVLPHEVTHTIFATHFRQPVPRWADEGACTTVEHASERDKQKRMLIQFLKTGQGISFSQLFRMKEYPRNVMPLYAQGHSLATFLIGQSSRREFLDYLGEGMQTENWSEATKRHYGYEGLAVLQNEWLDWVRQGSPPLESKSAPKTAVQLASTEKRVRPKPNLIYRAQSSDDSSSSQTKLVPVHTRTRAEAALARTRAGNASATVAKVANSTGAKRGWHAPGQAVPVSQVASAPKVSSSASRRSASDPRAMAGLDERGPVRSHAVRPQGFEKPGEVILQWSRKPGQGATRVLSRKPSESKPAPAPRFDGNRGRTLWR